MKTTTVSLTEFSRRIGISLREAKQLNPRRLKGLSIVRGRTL
jgi:hypothetical protein